LANKQIINISTKAEGEMISEKFEPNTHRKFKRDIFTDSEIKVLDNPFCKSGKKQRNSTSGNQKLTRKDAIKQRLKLKKMLICIWQLEEDAECIFAEISEEK
jgi:hypothetical protein